MTARLACSAGDPAHHLPPGSASSKNNRIFTVPVQAVGCVDWKPPKNSSLLKYLYVGDLVYIAKKKINSRFSTIKGVEQSHYCMLCFGVGVCT